MTTAWAIKERGEINVRTIMDTRIGAMVNWLSWEGSLLIRHHTDDPSVEIIFSKRASELKRSPEVVEVAISEVAR